MDKLRQPGLDELWLAHRMRGRFRLWLRALVIPAIPVLSLVLVFVGAAYARPDKLAEEGLSEANPLHRACVVGWRSSLPYILMLMFTYLPNVTSLSKWPAVSTPQSQSE